MSGLLLIFVLIAFCMQNSLHVSMHTESCNTIQHGNQACGDAQPMQEEKILLEADKLTETHDDVTHKHILVRNDQSPQAGYEMTHASDYFYRPRSVRNVREWKPLERAPIHLLRSRYPHSGPNNYKLLLGTIPPDWYRTLQKLVLLENEKTMLKRWRPPKPKPTRKPKTTSKPHNSPKQPKPTSTKSTKNPKEKSNRTSGEFSFELRYSKETEATEDDSSERLKLYKTYPRSTVRPGKHPDRYPGMHFQRPRQNKN